MGQGTDQLKRDIEETRAGMGETLDAIEDRIVPGRIMQRRKNRISEGVHSIRTRVMGTAASAQESVVEAAGDAPQAIKQRTQGAPLVAGGLAFGVGLLASVAFPPTDAERRASSKIRDKVEPAKEELMESAKDVAEHLREPAKQAAQEVMTSASESASSVQETAKDAAAEAKQQRAQ
jgi:hypothetical protein